MSIIDFNNTYATSGNDAYSIGLNYILNNRLRTIMPVRNDLSGNTAVPPPYVPTMPTQREVTWPGSNDYVNPFQSLLQPPNPLQSYNVQPASPADQMQSVNTNLFLQLLAQRLGRR